MKLCFTATFTGSPDHFTYPVFENFEIKFELYNLNKNLKKKRNNKQIKHN